MEPVPQHISFPKTEEEVLAYWERIDAFRTSIERNKGLPQYSFYDGPPFATGLPHYGHILAGTIKDTVTRYAHSTGHSVERRFGWDCHGLPIEFEIDKKLGVKTREQVLSMGIPRYNAECRSIVMRYSSEWESIIKRLGRWIDFQNDYKTMDVTFMESVWWVFKSLYEKGLVYRGFKVMPYSTACNTPLSNFEANLLYQSASDPEVYVLFPTVEDPTVKFVAWTTTPWTLPSNLALCVNPTLNYSYLKDNTSGDTLIVAADLIAAIYPPPKKSKNSKEAPALPYTVVKTVAGAELRGIEYVPLFMYFDRFKANGAFKVLTDDYVKADSGTGIVHQAPAFGEDDYRVCLSAGIIQKGTDVPCPIDDNGNFTSDVPDFAGMYLKDANENIKRTLKQAGRLLKSGTIVHQYPFCWRSETPLIYKAVSSWFVNVESVRDQLVENNKLTYWVPAFVEKRFHNWLASAIDWNISRNRYWGTPLPLWASPDFEELICIGSIQELEELSGVRVTDLHRESVDHITIPSRRGADFPPLRRVDEVFDCWFESGSMPYAQLHYPFENVDEFNQRFPADFIAEGIDQTRGWFYTLLVLSTCLKEKPAFKNLIVNGMVLAEDGKKMSKRLKNYPDPMFIVTEHGADALRLYLLNSPAVRGDDLRFQQQGVREVIRDVLLPWFNAYRFLVECTLQQQARTNQPFVYNRSLAFASDNVMDKWVLSASQSLLEFVHSQMKGYFLYKVGPQLVKFIEQLTNWYVRFNRKRMKGSNGEADCATSLNTLFEVLLTVTITMTPFTPFFTEYVYQNLRKAIPEDQREDSIHYLRLPTPVEEAKNARIERTITNMQSVIELGRATRDRRSKPIKFPLLKLTIILNSDEAVADLKSVQNYILEELNVRELELTTDEASYVSTVAVPDNKSIGTRLRGEARAVTAAIAALTHEQIREFQATGSITINGHEVTREEVQVVRTFKGDSKRYEAAWDQNALIVLELTETTELVAEFTARTMVNLIQKLRKKSKVNVSDPIEVFYRIADPNVADIIDSNREYIQNLTRVPVAPLQYKSSSVFEIDSQRTKLIGSALELVITRLSFAIDSDAVATLANKDAKFSRTVERLLNGRAYEPIAQQLRTNGSLSVVLDDTPLVLQLNKHVFLSAASKFDNTSK